MVLSMLLTSRRGLKWWWVCYRQAILLLNIRATRKEGGTANDITSRWTEFYGVAYNESNLRVMLSPCQYYVDKTQRGKPDARMRNGLWCGISPENVNAAYIWQGTCFITCAHGDVRTNEWIAWSITPVGVKALAIFDDDGGFALFSDETKHVGVPMIRELCE